MWKVTKTGIALSRYRFMCVFIGLLFILLFACSVFLASFYMQQRKFLLEKIKSKQALVLLSNIEMVHHDLELTLKNFILLSKLPELKKYMQNPLGKTDRWLIKELLAVAQINDIYGQIRFIDKNGMETLRINQEENEYVVVKKDELQDKSSRYYFKETIKLPEGEIYISPFDLNIEYGKIDPTKQITMRMGMCAYDSEGNKTGVFVVNYYIKRNIEKLLKERCFLIEMSSDKKPCSVLDAEGFQHNMRIDGVSLGALFPKIEDRMRKGSTHDQFLFKGTLVSFQDYQPYENYIEKKTLDKFGVYVKNLRQKLSNMVVLNIKSEVFQSYEFLNLRKSMVILASATTVFIVLISLLIAAIITKYYKSVSEIIEQNNKLEMATASTKSCVWSFHAETQTFNMNSSCGNIDKSIIRHVDDILDQTDEPFKRKLRDLISGDNLQSKEIAELEFKTKSEKDVRWALARGLVLERDREGKPLKTMGTFVDITEIKKSSEQIIAQAAFMLNDPAPVLKVDMNSYEIQECNPTTEKILGEKVVGREIEELLPGFRNRVSQASRTFCSMDLPVNESYFHFTIVSLKTLNAFYIYGSDISSLRNAQEQRDVLTNMVVHDIRNPLTVITGYMGVLARKLKGGDKEKKLLKVMQSEAERLQVLANHILDVSKMESDSMELNLEPCNVNELIRDLTESYSELFMARNIKLRYLIEADVDVKIDRSVIERVIQNLMMNALKYMVSGMEITIIATVNAMNEAVISVKDDGPGIPIDKQADIFNKFYQLKDKDSASKRHGVGLGLYFCKMAIDKHGGKIWVKSEVNQGSTFSFSLPIYTNAANQI